MNPLQDGEKLSEVLGGGKPLSPTAANHIGWVFGDEGRDWALDDAPPSVIRLPKHLGGCKGAKSDDDPRPDERDFTSQERTAVPNLIPPGLSVGTLALGIALDDVRDVDGEGLPSLARQLLDDGPQEFARAVPRKRDTSLVRAETARRFPYK